VDISRREFIRWALLLGSLGVSAGAMLSGVACGKQPSSGPTPTSTTTLTGAPSYTVEPTPTAETAYLSVARGQNPTAMVQAAVDALGGIGRFVKPGDDVIVKPNICGSHPQSCELAVTTNPEVVGALVALCVSAGASRVRVMDISQWGSQADAHLNSGIGDAVIDAGGEMEIIYSELKFPDTPIPQGRDITSWRVYDEILKTDVLINVPIAKSHELSVLSLGMKNLLGIVLRPWDLHSNLGQRIADLNSLVRPQLTVVDAVRILARNGPRGGSLDDVEIKNTVIASTDIIAADSYATTLFGLTGDDVPAIVAGADMELGTMDLDSIKIEEIDI